MKTDEAIWYLPSDSDQPAGPYTTADVTERLESGQCVGATLCWCDGMADWQPLEAVGPFAEALQRRRAAAKQRLLRIAAVLVVVVCVIGAGIAAYVVVMGPPEVRRAKELVSAGLYAEAIQVLKPYVDREPLDHEGRYLLAIAQVNQYAARDTGGGMMAGFTTTPASLAGAKRDLSQVLKAKPGWIEKARADMAAAAAMVPPAAPDGFARTQAIARLRAELNLADKRTLAAELMDQLVSSDGSEVSGLLRDRDALLQILDWDPSHGRKVVEWVIDGAGSSQYNLAAVLSLLDRWANERPVLSEPIASALLSKAQSLYQENRRSEAKTVLLKALEIDPEVATSQEHAMLCFELMDPDEAKLKRCRYFLSAWPQSPYVSRVLRVIVKDAVTAFDKYGRWQREKAKPYLDAGREMADRLVEHFPTEDGLDADVHELARRLAQNGQTVEALELTLELLAALPGTPRRLAIEEDRGQWRRQLETADAGESAAVPPLTRGSTSVPTLPMLPTNPWSSTRGGSVPSIAPQGPALPTRITSVGALKQALLSAATRRVLWVALGKDDIDLETRNKLRLWIHGGGVVWVETDLATLFGFTGLSKDRSTGQSGQAQVAPVNHPMVRGLVGRTVAYRSQSNGLTLSSGQLLLLEKRILPLLLAPSSSGDNVRLVCAGVPYGDGFTILRPMTLSNSSQTVRDSFESRLLQFSENATLDGWPGRQVNPRRRPPPGRQRYTR